MDEMQLNDMAKLLRPAGSSVEAVLAAARWLAIGAHPDDLEIMSWRAISAGPEFAGVVVADGAGSPRAGAYAQYKDDQMREIRRREQYLAAGRGEYGALLWLGYPSATFKQQWNAQLLADLEQVLAASSPEIVFTHNPCDRHVSHVAVAMHVIAALRNLPASQRPGALYGCEVWGGLDWLERGRVCFDVSPHEALASELIGCFRSQIEGGKRYDVAAPGRRHAHATFANSHAVDETTAAELAMDLTPLAKDPSLDPRSYVDSLLRESSRIMLDRLRPFA